MCTEERKKAKQSYKESLQNVATVRQQAAVSHLSSFMLPREEGGCGVGGGVELCQHHA